MSRRLPNSHPRGWNACLLVLKVYGGLHSAARCRSFSPQKTQDGGSLFQNWNQTIREMTPQRTSWDANAVLGTPRCLK